MRYLISVFLLLWCQLAVAQSIQYNPFTTNATGAAVDMAGAALSDGSYTGNGAGLTNIPSTSLAGVVPIANGGTGTNSNALAENQVGVFQLSSDTPVGTTNAATSALQLGVSGDRFLFVSTSTSAGAWRGDFNFLADCTFGHPYLAGAGSPTQVNEYLSGDPSLQTIAHQSDDSVHRIIGVNPFGTGGGTGFVLTTTNPAGNGTAISTNSSAQPVYLRQGDVNGYSIVGVPEQAVTNDLPGWLLFIGDSSAFPMAFAENTSVAGKQGDYPFSYMTNGVVAFPQWLGTNNFPPAGTGENRTLKLDLVNNQVTMGSNTLLFGGAGASQLTIAAGNLNAGAFSSTQGGTMTLDTTTIRGTNFLSLSQKDFADGIGYSVVSGGGMNYSVATHGIAEVELGLASQAMITMAQGSENGGTGGFNPGPTITVGYGSTNQGNTIGNATLQVQGSIATYLTNQTSNYTTPATNSTVLMNGSGITNVLPDASFHAKGRTYIIKNINSSPLTLIATNNQTFDGGLSNITILQNESIQIQSDGSNWQITGGNDGGLLTTNFISGQLYTNTYGQPIEVSGNATLSVAAVVGNAVMALQVSGTRTNISGMSTLVTSIAMNYTNYLAIKVPAGSTYVWTNLSTGAGNSASVSGGQIMTQ